MALVPVDRRKYQALQNDATTTHTFTIPYVGWTAGDEAWVSVFASDGDNTANLPAPAGWTRVSDVDFSASFHPAIYRRTLLAGDGGTKHVFTYGGTNQKYAASMTIHGPGGVAVLATPTSAGSTTTCPAPTLAVTNASVAVVHAGCRGGTTPTSVSISGSGWTTVGASYSSGGGQVSAAVFENLTPVSNSTINPGDIVWNNSTSTVAWLIVFPQVDSSVALYPPTRPEPDMVAAATFPAYIVHRGGADEGPENVLLTYRKNMGKNKSVWAEGDVHSLTGTTRLAMNHDATRDRLDADGLTGNVASMTEAQWKARRVTWPAEYTTEIPEYAMFADQLLDEYKGEGLYYIETKSSTANTTFLQYLFANNLEKQVVVASFDEQESKEAAGAGAYTVTQTSDLTPRGFANIKAAGLWAISVDRLNMSAQVCTDAHAAGLKVLVYTVGSISERNTMLGHGADGIITNSPTLLVPAQSSRVQKRIMNFTMMM